MNSVDTRLEELKLSLDGELKYDNITRIIYSTDASVYREKPLAVVWPRGGDDIKKILKFASGTKTGVTIRAAGTSLAGQVVGSGIIADISKYMNRILEVNPEEKWVRVEPGVVLDELNIFLRQYGLFFGPETSTSNRCNIGGMVGNNACGSHSLVYGSTRDHTLELRAILSDGSEAVFGPLGRHDLDSKCQADTLEGKIYRNIRTLLSDPVNCESIREGYPDPLIPRRNSGYALDLLLDSKIFSENSSREFNMCRLLAGSEGTLAVITEIKLNLVPVPPPHKALVCVHHRERNEAFRANMTALKYKPVAVEMMDNRILELTEGNLSQKNNRFFLEGKPGSVMIVEFARDTVEELELSVNSLIEDLKIHGLGYAYPVIRGKDIGRVWNLRKAGLGILANMKGDPKPVSLIEDTAVRVEQLDDYIGDIGRLLEKSGKDAVYHAHIGTGELHLRPVLNLKDPDDVILFRKIGTETARIVKKFRGSMSGEHGDGRLRGEFIPIILGERNYMLLKEIKLCWDPCNILNPGKIVSTPPMDTSLRYQPGKQTREIKTILDFSSTAGIIRAAEKCNGSADCRKSIMIGGTMCPSYMATGEEKNTTRARANVIREFLSDESADPWNHREIYEILDLCLSCKGCKSECPSGVDMAKLKSEFLQHWHDKHRTSVRTMMFAYITSLNRIGSFFPYLYNFFLKNRFFSGLVKRISGIAIERNIPLLYKTTLRRWALRNLPRLNPSDPKGTVSLFIDEFTNFNDTESGIAAIKLLTSLGYRVLIPDHCQSGRTFISKGFLRSAAKKARRNIGMLSEVISDGNPLVGLEPSAILSFRDEYPDLAGEDLREASLKLASCTFLLEEFVVREFRAGRISKDDFVNDRAVILVHGHCQQKAIVSTAPTLEMLSIPAAYSVSEIPSGCCGMAGSFGYEKEHYQLSMKIGEMVLFPEIRDAGEDTIIAAPGTSCRSQIFDGTGRTARHPADILYSALKSKRQ